MSVEDLVARVWESLAARANGPMPFHLVLQPAIAAFMAIRAGAQDARDGSPAYFWAILTNGAERYTLLREGWKAVAKVFILAAILDVAFQVVVLRSLHPGEALGMAFLLACVPYLLIRGPVNRLLRSRHALTHRPT